MHHAGVVSGLVSADSRLLLQDDHVRARAAQGQFPRDRQPDDAAADDGRKFTGHGSQNYAAVVSERPHGLVPMRGRDTREEHRVASTLELLYDLTIVVSFSLAGAAFAHATVSGHFLNGLVAFLIAMFAIVWAWLTFTWFSSAYDTDDWGMRLSVLIQMIGVIVLALGLGDLFHGMNEWEFHNTIVVAGYVIMRISMVGLWLRAANADPTRRTDCRRYAAYTLVVQILWIITAMLHMKMSVAGPRDRGDVRHGDARPAPDRGPADPDAVASAPHRRAVFTADHHYLG